MINLSISRDGRFILIEGASVIEQSRINLYFTKKIPDWFVIKKKYPYAIVDESFVFENKIIPAGLWIEFFKMAEKNGIQFSVSPDFNDRIMNSSISYDGFKYYANELVSKSGMVLKEYQIKGVYSIMKYKRCCVEVSTNGGKTLMCYVMFKYLRDILKKQHILYITPKTVLTSQSAEKFLEYDKDCKIETDWTYDEIHATAKKKKEYNSSIVFGNFQSLCKKKKDFFEKFDAVIVDECHHTTAASIKNILQKCINADYKVGLTGTFPKEGSYEYFSIQSYIGPLVYKFTSYELIKEEKFATPVEVVGIRLSYLSNDERKLLHEKRRLKDKDNPTEGNELLNEEKDIARKSKLRLNWICDFITKFNKNTLVVFTDVKTQYGYKVYSKLKDMCDKNIYYIDGDTKDVARKYAKQAMEDDKEGNTIIVSSIGCFSEGIDISNLWNIVLIETTKSDILMAQLLGRGMRRYEGKEKTRMFDITDDYSIGSDYYKDNYLLKHYKERVKIYNERRFDYLGECYIDLTTKALF